MNFMIRSKGILLLCTLFFVIHRTCAYTATLEHSFDGQNFHRVASLDIDEVCVLIRNPLLYLIA